MKNIIFCLLLITSCTVQESVEPDFCTIEYIETVNGYDKHRVTFTAPDIDSVSISWYGELPSGYTTNEYTIYAGPYKCPTHSWGVTEMQHCWITVGAKINESWRYKTKQTK